MEKLTRQDLMSLEEYSEKRNSFREHVIEHKKNRQLAIADHATLYFEDRLTMQYQIQEMLRIERIFEAEAIQEELDAYNSLIPDGKNWKATFMIEYEDEDERREALENLIGIEDTVWVRVDGFDKVYAIADEDLDRESTDKTSSVHFLRFELDDDMAKAVKTGSSVSAGVDHDDYHYAVEPLPKAVRDSLANDLQPLLH